MGRFLLLVVLFINLQYVFSQTCCSGGVPLSSTIGLSNESKGVLQLGINYDYNNLNTLNAGDTTLDDESRLRITNAIIGSVGYNITDRVAIEGLFTWINQRRRITNFGNENIVSTTGIGDAVLMAKYALPNILGKSSSWVFGIGTRIPIGSTENEDARGIVLAADLQPGSGAWDAIFFMAIQKNPNFRPSMTLFSRATYRNTGTNDEYLEVFDYRFGSEFQVFAGVSDQRLVFKKLLTYGLSFKYRNAAQDRIREAIQESTGGEWVFLIPSISIPIVKQFSFLTRIEVPLYSFVEGTQLTPTYRLTFGLQTKLNVIRKKEFNLK